MMKKWLLFGLICFQAACVSAPPQTMVAVYKSDGSRQCESGGVSPETMQTELSDIQVYAARKDVLRDRMFAAVCGGMTGNVNVYTIAADDLPKAEQLGFMPFRDEQ